jgi:prevent-host-death family protein
VLNWSDDQFGYNEVMNTVVVTATEFKAKCLSLLDEVNAGKCTITVTKRGKPVATVVAPKKKVSKKNSFMALKGAWKGLIEYDEDLIRRNRVEINHSLMNRSKNW